MSLQARMSESDQRVYNPSRDVAHNFNAVVAAVAERLDKRAWPELEKCLPVPDDDAGEACRAFIEFILTALDDPKADMQEMLVRSGWFKVTPEAQVAYMAQLGVVMAGVFFKGVREATLGGRGPLDTVADLVAAGRRCQIMMGMPRWQRPFWVFWVRLQATMRAARQAV